MSSDFIEPHILKIWDGLPSPKSLSLAHLGDILNYSYRLLDHPRFFGEVHSEDMFISLLTNDPDQYETFNRILIERIIHEAAYYGNVKFDFGILTMSSQGIDNVVKRIKDVVFAAEKINRASDEEQSSFGAGLRFFRLHEKGAMTGAVKYLLNACQYMILDVRTKILKIELKTLRTETEKFVFLQRKKANLLQEQNAIDKKIYKGLMEWIEIELNFLDSIKSKINGLDELSPIIQKFLAQQEARTTADTLLQHLIRSEIDQFNEKLADMVMQVLSYHDISGKEPEKVFHAFLLGIFQSLNGQYRVVSNKEAGKGRFDIMLIPDHLFHDGVIFEVKKLNAKNTGSVEDSLGNALQQIKERGYSKEFKNSGTNIYIGIAAVFLGKELYTKWYRDSVT